MARSDFGTANRALINAVREVSISWTDELNTYEMYAAQQQASMRALAELGWTWEEFFTENTRLLVEARETMLARIEALRRAEEQT